MKKLICSFLIVVIIICPLASCTSESLLKTNSSHLLLQACVHYSVPGFYQSDLKGNSADVVEVDDFGRTLVSFEGYNRFTDKDECVYVICQAYSDSTIYFYEDANYAWMSEPTFNLDDLKKENDWNCELNMLKCSARPIRVSFDLNLVKDFTFPDFSSNRFYYSLSITYGISKDSIASAINCDWDGHGHLLYALRLNNGEAYFCIVDTEYNTYAAGIESFYDCKDVIRQLKSDSNWHYGS